MTYSVMSQPGILGEAIPDFGENTFHADIIRALFALLIVSATSISSAMPIIIV